MGQIVTNRISNKPYLRRASLIFLIILMGLLSQAGCTAVKFTTPTIATADLPGTVTPTPAMTHTSRSAATQTATPSPTIVPPTNTAIPTETLQPMPTPQENWWAVVFERQRKITVRYAMENEDGSLLLWGQETSQDGDTKGDLIAKIDRNGSMVWEKAITPRTARGQVARKVDDGIELLGLDENQGFTFALKLRVNGEVDWAKTYASTLSDLDFRFMRLPEADSPFGLGSVKFSTEPDLSQVVETFVQLPDGDVVVAGPMYGTTKGSQGGTWSILSGLWAIRIDPQDQIVWQRIYQSEASPLILGSAMRDGGIVLVRVRGNPSVSSIVRIDASGNVIFWKHYEIVTLGSISETPDGGIILTGGRNFMKLDAGGEVVWRKEFAEAEDQIRPHYVLETRDGDLILFARSTNLGTIVARIDVDEPFSACGQLQIADSPVGEHFPLLPLNISQSVKVSPRSSVIDEADNRIVLYDIASHVLEVCRYTDPTPTLTPSP